jgi:molybdopterin-containing oxidoreductase family membrane subunit
MERNYSTIEGTSRGYTVLVALLGVMVGVFIVSFLVAYLKGQQVWGVSNIIPWGQLITFYIYFIGLSAGAIIISSLSYVFKREIYEPIGRMAVLMGILLMVGAMCFVMVELGRPEKAWRLFMYFYLNNMTSLFAINTIFYTGYIALMLVYLWLIFEGKKRLAAIVGTVDVLWAIAVHMGTGAIFGLIGNREIFFSPIKPFEFLTAALTSGTSLIILTAVVTFKLTRRVIQDELIFSLGRLLTSMILILLVMVFFDKLTHLYFPNREATVYLFTGDYWWIFWIFQIGMGIVLPLILLIHPMTKKTHTGDSPSPAIFPGQDRRTMGGTRNLSDYSLGDPAQPEHRFARGTPVCPWPEVSGDPACPNRRAPSGRHRPSAPHGQLLTGEILERYGDRQKRFGLSETLMSDTEEQN